MASSFTFSLEDLADQESLENARDEAQAKLSEEGSQLARMKWPLFRDAAVRGMKSKLGEIDPFAKLAEAWGAAVEVQQLAAKTKANPGSKEPYPLSKHSLSASVHPVVTLRCGPINFPALTFTVAIEGQVDSAILILADGKLHSIEALSLTPAAVLSYEKGELAKELTRLPGQPFTPIGPYVFSDGGIEIPFV